MDRASGGDRARDFQSDRLRVGIITTDEDVLVGTLPVGELGGCEGVHARDDRAIESGLEALGERRRLRASEATPAFVIRSSAAIDSNGVVPIAARSDLAVSRALSAVVVSTMKSAALTAFSFVPAATPIAVAAAWARSASREPITTL